MYPYILVSIALALLFAVICHGAIRKRPGAFYALAILLVVLSRVRGPRDAMYILLVHYSGARNEEDVRRAIGPNPYKIKSKTLRKNDVEMAVEIRMKRNNLRFVDALREVEGIKDVTLVQYSGDYID